MEVEPAYDSSEITVHPANRVMLEASSAIAKRRIGTPYSAGEDLLDGRNLSATPSRNKIHSDLEDHITVIFEVTELFAPKFSNILIWRNCPPIEDF